MWILRLGGDRTKKKGKKFNSVLACEQGLLELHKLNCTLFNLSPNGVSFNDNTVVGFKL